MAKRRAPRATEWLLSEGATQQGVPASSQMTFEDEHWTASIERVDIGDGLRVFLTKAEVRRSLSLEPVQSVPGVWLCSKVAVKGRVSVSFAGGEHIQLTPDRSMLCRPHDGKARFTPKPRQSLRLAGYMLRADRVESLCDGDIPAAIRPFVADEIRHDLLIAVASTAHLQRVAARMFSDQFSGPLREVYLEGIALQLFALQSAIAAGAARPKPSRGLSVAERKAVRTARERLLADMANPPTAAVIAAAAAMSERRLNAGFKALFGTTIFETLRNERLEHARVVLETEALPLKVVAERVGYRHTTNFINAFSARYGTPPRQFAHSRGGASRQTERRGRSRAAASAWPAPKQ